MRKERKLLAANWKMHLRYEEAIDLARQVGNYLRTVDFYYKVVLAPAFPYLRDVKNETNKVANLCVAAQNVSEHEKGAYTGEVSAEMIASVGVDYCIVGHSERRKYFNENEDILLKKIKLLLENGIIPIYCVGETLEERKEGISKEVVEKQLTPILSELSEKEIKNFVIAYEPVWAIGTGEAATPQDANEMHLFIRELIANRFNRNIAEGVTILYGGSVKPENAEALFSMPEIDGGLVGGASLKAKSFNKLIEILFK